jgi:hypothetical protein
VVLLNAVLIGFNAAPAAGFLAVTAFVAAAFFGAGAAAFAAVVFFAVAMLESSLLYETGCRAARF